MSCKVTTVQEPLYFLHAQFVSAPPLSPRPQAQDAFRLQRPSDPDTTLLRSAAQKYFFQGYACLYNALFSSTLFEFWPALLSSTRTYLYGTPPKLIRTAHLLSLQEPDNTR